jgi:hypothetical protein
MGIVVVAIFLGYCLLTLMIMFITFFKTRSVKKTLLSFIIMFLIPTWDIILGYPVFSFFCTYKSGAYTYKSAAHIEGFYIGVQSKWAEPVHPFDGYKYVDYQSESKGLGSGNYFRSYWADNNTSELCVSVRHQYGDYGKAFQEGRCIIKEPLHVTQVSRYFYDTNNYWKQEYSIPLIRLHRVYGNKIIDRSNNEVIAEIKEYKWFFSWIPIVIGYGSPGMMSKNCFLDRNDNQEIEYQWLREVLKPTNEEK